MHWYRLKVNPFAFCGNPHGLGYNPAAWQIVSMLQDGDEKTRGQILAHFGGDCYRLALEVIDRMTTLGMLEERIGDEEEIAMQSDLYYGPGDHVASFALNMAAAFEEPVTRPAEPDPSPQIPLPQSAEEPEALRPRELAEAV